MQTKTLSCLLLLVLLSACAVNPTPAPAAQSPTLTAVAETPLLTPSAKPVAPYQDVRDQDLTPFAGYLDPALVRTLWLNQKTVWPADVKDFAARILEDGKNPGLGLRALHARGITGQGVTVAIIDQNLVTAFDHPEFAGKILQYKDFGTGQSPNAGSMHGPAVTSLLAGETIGAAPGVRVYYAAAPSWTLDAQYYADALDWIVAENEKLPPGQKIRVVSVSAAPSGQGSPFKQHNAAWDAAYQRAAQTGLLILDCTSQNMVVGPCHFDPGDPDAVEKCLPGWPDREIPAFPHHILVPTSYRTTAEEYSLGEFGYQYDGEGGMSWAVPYLAGVLALGWQLRPELTGQQLLDVIFQTAYQRNGYTVINPPAFIKALK